MTGRRPRDTYPAGKRNVLTIGVFSETGQTLKKIALSRLVNFPCQFQSKITHFEGKRAAGSTRSPLDTTCLQYVIYAYCNMQCSKLHIAIIRVGVLQAYHRKDSGPRLNFLQDEGRGSFFGLTYRYLLTRDCVPNYSKQSHVSQHKI